MKNYVTRAVRLLALLATVAFTSGLGATTLDLEEGAQSESFATPGPRAAWPEYGDPAANLGALTRLVLVGERLGVYEGRDAVPDARGTTVSRARTGIPGEGERVDTHEALAAGADTSPVHAEMGGHGSHIGNNHRGMSVLSNLGRVSPEGEAQSTPKDWLFTLQYSDLAPAPAPTPIVPIPEPATGSLVLLGIAGLAWRGRHR